MFSVKGENSSTSTKGSSKMYSEYSLMYSTLAGEEAELLLVTFEVPLEVASSSTSTSGVAAELLVPSEVP